MSDNGLIEGIKNGESKALSQLQKKYGRLLYGITKKYIDDKYSDEEIDECYSDIVVAIWESIDSFKEGKRLINFIGAIAKYTAIDYKRKLDRRREVVLNEEILESGYEEEFDIDQLESFKDKLSSLSEEDRLIFIKRYYLEESIEKISKEINISKDTVYKRLSRGREKLRNELEGKVCY